MKVRKKTVRVCEKKLCVYVFLYVFSCVFGLFYLQVLLDMTPYTGVEIHRVSVKNEKAIKALEKKFKNFGLEIDVDNAPIAIVHSSESRLSVVEAEEDDGKEKRKTFELSKEK